MLIKFIKATLLIFISLYIGRNQDLIGQVLEQDSLALVALYNNTSDSNWTNKTNWLTNEPVSDWFGVTVLNNRVVKLDLSVNNLVGTIPHNFYDLTGLTELNLERNEISGPFPDEILALTNLTVLKIRNNQFNGHIPSNIDELINLEHLELSNNPLSGQLPSEIGNLSNLTDLRISGTFSIDGPIPPEFGNLVNLRYLSLFMNKLNGNIPPELGKMTNLEYLELYWNELTGEIPSELGNLASMTFMPLHKNQLTGSIPSELGKLKLITHLRLDNNRLTGRIPSELGNINNLKLLFLNSNQLSGAVPDEIANLSNLQKFHIDHNQLSGLPDLSSLTALTELFIEENNFTFWDIEPNVGIAATFSYSPQDSLGIEMDTTIDIGASITFTVSSAGGDNSIYQWIKNDLEIEGAVDSIYTIESATMDNSGTYMCEVTNSIASELTLYSMPFNLIVGIPVDVENELVKLPGVFILSQNYPNPFNPSTTINYSIPKQSNVTIKIFDVLGSEVTTLVNKEQPQGNYEVELDGSDLTSGIYFYRLQAGDFIETKKMILLK